jgi:CubicO group peptidase (beta-lactamase class C family)
LSAAPAAGPGDPAEVGAFFDQLIAQQLAGRHIVGATVVVVEDGALRFAKGYGYADVAGQVPVDPDRTLFDLGSAGKLFTATAVMQLVEQGRIDLNAVVNDYLAFRIPATSPAPITVAHLLCHTAGFAEQYLGIQTTRAGFRSLRDFLVSAMPPRVSPPGRYHAYSNYGFQLAGSVVQRVSGEPFEQYLEAHLLAPLGMTHSAAVQPPPAALAPDMSKGYRYRAGAPGGHQPLAGVGEHPRREPERPHPRQLVDLTQQRLQPQGPRIRLELGQHTAPRGGRLVVVGRDEGLEAAKHRRRQPGHGPGAEGLLGLRPGRPQEPLHPAGARRFQPVGPAPGQGGYPVALGFQPRGEPLEVPGHRALRG